MYSDFRVIARRWKHHTQTTTFTNHPPTSHPDNSLQIHATMRAVQQRRCYGSNEINDQLALVTHFSEKKKVRTLVEISPTRSIKTKDNPSPEDNRSSTVNDRSRKRLRWRCSAACTLIITCRLIYEKDILKLPTEWKINNDNQIFSNAPDPNAWSSKSGGKRTSAILHDGSNDRAFEGGHSVNGLLERFRMPSVKHGENDISVMGLLLPNVRQDWVDQHALGITSTGLAEGTVGQRFTGDTEHMVAGRTWQSGELIFGAKHFGHDVWPMDHMVRRNALQILGVNTHFIVILWGCVGFFTWTAVSRGGGVSWGGLLCTSAFSSSFTLFTPLPDCRGNSLNEEHKQHESKSKQKHTWDRESHRERQIVATEITI